MKKILKIVFIVVTILILGFVLLFANAFYGNPISKALANYNADKYIQQNYKDLNLIKEECSYNFKFANYYVHVQSNDSIDTAFDIYFNSYGKAISDSYDSISYNTWKRLDNEIMQEVRNILVEKFPQENNKINAHMVDIGLDEELPLDLPLDIKNTPHPLEISIQTFSDEKTYEKVAEVMVTAQETLHEEDIEVAEYSVIIIPLKDKVDDFSSVSWADALVVSDIPVGLLSEVNPSEAIKYYDEHQYDITEK